MSELRIHVTRGPEGGVLWIDATANGQSIRVAGWCRYWIDGPCIGVFNCPEHQEFGKPTVHRWDGERFDTEPGAPPDGVQVLVGELLPDEKWRELIRDG